jgi:hypothetical protein
MSHTCHTLIISVDDADDHQLKNPQTTKAAAKLESQSSNSDRKHRGGGYSVWRITGGVQL